MPQQPTAPRRGPIRRPGRRVQPLAGASSGTGSVCCHCHCRGVASCQAGDDPSREFKSDDMRLSSSDCCAWDPREPGLDSSRSLPASGGCGASSLFYSSAKRPANFEPPSRSLRPGNRSAIAGRSCGSELVAKARHRDGLAVNGRQLLRTGRPACARLARRSHLFAAAPLKPQPPPPSRVSLRGLPPALPRRP